MSVAGYEKVKTKVIEGKKKCIYKKHKGTKLYVKGFGKMRSVESYVKLCKKAAAKSTKPATKSKKVRSKSTRKYGGFLQEFFANIEAGGEVGEKKEKDNSKLSPPANSQEVVKQQQHFNNPSPDNKMMTPANMAKTGGSNCNRHGGYRGGNGLANDLQNSVASGLSVFSGGYRGGNNMNAAVSGGYRGGYRGGNGVVDNLQNSVASVFSGGYRGGYRGGQLDQFQDASQDAQQDQDVSQDGGRRRKRNKAPISILDKLMMAATFRKNSVKKGKKLRRKGGNVFEQVKSTIGNLDLMGGKRKRKNY
jgi:hypothetical protein